MTTHNKLKLRWGKALVFGSCLLVAAVAVSAASAGGGGDPGGQLLDVSKQVASIQKKVDKAVAKDGSLPAGELLRGAACGFGETSQLFQAWGDGADYALAPQGDLAATDQWAFGKRATLSPDHDPYSGSQQSVLLAGDGEAASPAICVNLDNPSVRLFVKNTAAASSALKVDLLYEGTDGKIKNLTIAKLRAGADWQPSIVIPIYLNTLATASASGLTAVAFQFKPEGVKGDSGGGWQLDGLYVDPWKGR